MLLVPPTDTTREIVAILPEIQMQHKSNTNAGTNVQTLKQQFLSENKVESGYFQTKGLNFKSKKWRKSKLTFPLNLARPLTDKTRLLLSHLSLTLLPDFASRF